MKIALHAFPGCAQVLVPIPPVVAAIYCGNRGCDHHIARFGEGPVPFAVFVDIGGLDAQEACAYVMQRRAEVIDSARKLLVSAVSMN